MTSRLSSAGWVEPARVFWTGLVVVVLVVCYLEAVFGQSFQVGQVLNHLTVDVPGIQTLNELQTHTHTDV